jgi:hypothetical protein
VKHKLQILIHQYHESIHLQYSPSKKLLLAQVSSNNCYSPEAGKGESVFQQLLQSEACQTKLARQGVGHVSIRSVRTSLFHADSKSLYWCSWLLSIPKLPPVMISRK